MQIARGSTAHFWSTRTNSAPLRSAHPQTQPGRFSLQPLTSRVLASSTASQTIQHTPASYSQRLYECFGGVRMNVSAELRNYGEFRHISLSSRQRSRRCSQCITWELWCQPQAKRALANSLGINSRIFDHHHPLLVQLWVWENPQLASSSTTKYQILNKQVHLCLHSLPRQTDQQPITLSTYPELI